MAGCYTKTTPIGLALRLGLSLVLASSVVAGCGTDMDELRCKELLTEFRKFRDFGDTDGRYDAMEDRVREAESRGCDMGQFV